MTVRKPAARKKPAPKAPALSVTDPSPEPAGLARGSADEGGEAAAKHKDEAAPVCATPLDYMLSVMRDPAVDSARRDEMAKLALPYMHPKVTAAEPGRDLAPPEAAGLSETDIARRIAFTLAKAMQLKPVTH